MNLDTVEALQWFPMFPGAQSIAFINMFPSVLDLYFPEVNAIGPLLSLTPGRAS